MDITQLKVAADVMTRKPNVIHSSMSIRDVATLFLEHSYSSAPVVGNTGEVLGIIDEFSLIKVKLLQHLVEEAKDKLAHHTEYLVPAHFVSESTPLVDVVKEMIKAPNHRILVLNKAKALMGIISPKDVLRYVVGEREKSVNLKEELEKTKKNLDSALGELEQTKSRLEIYKDMVMDNPTMIHSIDGNGKIIMANRKMHDMLGYAANELIGKSMFEIYTDAVHSDAVSGLKKIMSDGFHQNTFTTMVKKNGDKMRVDIASTALLDSGGKFIGTISVSRPVDADILLRALHGVLSKDVDGDNRYGLIKEAMDAVEGTAPKTTKKKA